MFGTGPELSPSWAFNLLFIVMRWIHLVCTTLLVGGMLFFEFVLPRAVENLKSEQQMAVFGFSRWIFRRVVVLSVILLTLSGAVSSWRLWYFHTNTQYEQLATGWTWSHVGLALLAMVIALTLTNKKHIGPLPIRWLRINLIILMVVIFLADVSRHVRMEESEHGINVPTGKLDTPSTRSVSPVPAGPVPASNPALLPTTHAAFHH